MTRFARLTSSVAVSSLLLAAGCGQVSQTREASPEKTAIVIGAVPATDTAGLYIAQQRGFFAAEGLKVTIVPIVSAELAISKQLAGGFDITLGGYVSYVQADAEQHADLRVIAEGSIMQPSQQALMTWPGSRITSLSKLKGATVALNVVNNLGTILIGSALEAAGIPVSAVRFVGIPFPFMAAALAKHQVAAAWMPEPFVSLTEEQIGAPELSDLNEGATAEFPLVGYAATRTWEQRYPHTLAAFRRALEKGQELADTSRPAVEQAVEKFVGVPPMTAAVMTLPQFPLGVDQVRLQRVADAMLRFGLLKRPFDTHQLIG
jgi:NitT/TauT family transport system substrate-binding protein